MTNYFIPEPSELGQYLLDISAHAGGMIECVQTKTEFMENLDYIIWATKELKKDIESKKINLDNYKGVE